MTTPQRSALVQKVLPKPEIVAAILERWILALLVVVWLLLCLAFYGYLAFVDRAFLALDPLTRGPVFTLKLLLWLVVPCGAFFMTIARLKRRAYVAAFPTALVVIAGFGVALYGPTIGALLRFEVERPTYVARIEKARAGGIDSEIATGLPILAFFPWGGFVTNTYGVIYDESKMIAEPLAVRRERWRDRVVPDGLLCEGRVTPLHGAFYLGDFVC
jgi:hypothetical protein